MSQPDFFAEFGGRPVEDEGDFFAEFGGKPVFEKSYEGQFSEVVRRLTDEGARPEDAEAFARDRLPARGFDDPEIFESLFRSPDKPLRPATPEELPGRTRRGIETTATLLAGLGTGGLSLIPRIATMAGVGAASSVAAEPFDPSGSVESATERAAKSGAFAAAGELGGSLVAKGIGKVAGGLFRSSDPTRVAAQEAIQEAGGTLPLAQASGSNTARLIQSVAESSVGGAGPIQAAKERALDLAREPIEELAENLTKGATREELGAITQSALEGNVEAFKQAAAARYAEIDKVIEAAARQPGGERIGGVSTLGLKMRARQLAKEGLPKGSKSANAVIRSVLDLPDEIGFKRASEVRSDLLSFTRDVTDPLVTKAQGQIKQLIKAAGQAIDDAAAPSSVNRFAVREILRLKKAADDFYKQGAAKFNNDLTRAIAGKRPEAVLDSFLKSNRPGTIRLAREVIGSPRIWEQIQGAYVRQIIEASVEKGSQKLSGGMLLTQLKNFKPAALKELLGPKEATIRELARTLQIAEEFTGKTAGGISIRGLPDLGGVAVGISTGDFYTAAATSATIAISANLMARFLTNPTVVRLLTQARKVPPGSQTAARIMGQLGALAARMESEEKKREARP